MPADRPSPARDDAPDTAERTLLELLLVPHRSLGPVGFHVLMIAISAISFGAGLAFYLIGAWPVIGFMGLDVALIYLAFRVSYNRARGFEMVRLTETALTVERVSPRGERWRWVFQPYWLRVEMDDPPEHHSQLRLRSHGRALTIGAFLGPAERQQVADCLRSELAQLRMRGAAG